MTRGAVAIFVKTPGHSPVKTRLACAIGVERAEMFHRLSAAAVAAVVRRAAETSPLAPYWAVAESAATSDPLWSGFPTIWQGDGGLGSRLSRTYEHLLTEHPFVLFLGADAPQLTPALLIDASAHFEVGPREARFLIGRATDGGFSLFGGNAPIPRDVWDEVPYSSPDTAERLAARLRPFAPIHDLPTLTDVDTRDDLPTLLDALDALHGPLPEQQTLRHWIVGSAILETRR